MSKLPPEVRAFFAAHGRESQKIQKLKYTPEELRRIRSEAGKKGNAIRWKLSTGKALR